MPINSVYLLSSYVSATEKELWEQGEMKDPLDMEIAGEIDKISLDIKTILKKIETFYPKEKDPLPPEEKNSSNEKPGS
jgi:hypothetical protein